MEVKSLVVERGDGVANDLVGQFTDRFAYQIGVGFGDFDASQTTGELHRGFKVDIKNDPAFDLTHQANLGRDSFSPVRFLFHAEVLDGNGRVQCLGQHGVGRINERLNQVHPH